MKKVFEIGALLLVAVIVLSSAGSNILSGVLLLLWGGYKVVKKERVSSFNYLILVYMIFLLLSITHGLDMDEGRHDVAKYIKLIFVYIFLMDVVVKDKVINYLKVLSVSGMIYYIYAFYNLFVKNENIFKGNNAKASFAMLFTILFFINFIRGNKIKERSVDFLFSGISLFFLVSSGSRGAILAFAGSLFFIWVIMFVKKDKRAYFVLSLILILSIGVLSSDRTMKKLKALKDIKKNSSTRSRILMQKSALDMIKRNPLFGNGMGSFEKAHAKNIDEKYSVEFEGLSMREKYRPHPHNYFLLVLVEQGVISFFIFMVILWQLFKLAIKNIKSEIEDVYYIGLLLFGMLVGTIAHNMVDSLFNYTYLFMIVVVVVVVNVELKKLVMDD